MDRWTVPGPGGGRVKTDRHGRGKRWLARWVDDTGKRASRACTTKVEAQALLAEVDVARRSGTYVAPSTVTVGEWAAVWQARQVHHRASTAGAVANRLERHVLPVLGDVRLRDLTRGHVQDLVVAASSTLAPGTVRLVHVHVRTLLGAAVEERLIVRNPAVGVRLPERSRARVEPLTTAQVRALADGVPARWRAVVLLGAASGLRISELLGLTWDRVRDGVLVVDRQLVGIEPDGHPVWGPPKTPASDRRVAVDEETLRHLLEHRGVHGDGLGGLVFSSLRRGGYTRGRAGEAWRAAGVPGLRVRSGWHDLRHFHASVLVSAGVSVRAVADRLGHDDPGITLRTYAHLMPSDEERSLAAVSAALWGPT